MKINLELKDSYLCKLFRITEKVEDATLEQLATPFMLKETEIPGIFSTVSNTEMKDVYYSKKDIERFINEGYWRTIP